MKFVVLVFGLAFAVMAFLSFFPVFLFHMLVRAVFSLVKSIVSIVDKFCDLFYDALLYMFDLISNALRGQ